MLFNKLQPEAYGIANLSLQQIMDNLAKKCFDADLVW